MVPYPSFRRKEETISVQIFYSPSMYMSRFIIFYTILDLLRSMLQICPWMEYLRYIQNIIRLNHMLIIGDSSVFLKPWKPCLLI